MLLPLWDGVEEGDGEGAGGGHALGGTRVRGIEWCRERLEAVLNVVVAGREEGIYIYVYICMYVCTYTKIDR
jgi:hypothetical protein